MKVGIIGAGQLAQMLAQAGKSLSITCIALSDTAQPPAASDATIWQVNPDCILQQIDKLLDETDVVTFDYEHVPDAWLEKLAASKKVLPSSDTITLAKNRAKEKALCAKLDVAVGAYQILKKVDDVQQAYEQLGPDVIIKACSGGYDGKHQWRVRSIEDCQAFIDNIKHLDHIMESVVPFICEVSLCAVRNREGDILYYPLFRNEHVDGILHQTHCPDPDFSNNHVEKQAQEACQKILSALDYVGVCTIEFFVTADHQVLFNEMAPRVHNSGHHTIESTQTSQFENHLRAILALPLGPTELVAPCRMENILSKTPDLTAVLDSPKAHVHLYGKAERSGRKLGHITYILE